MAIVSERHVFCILAVAPDRTIALQDLVLLFSGGVLAWSLTGLLVRALGDSRHVAAVNERSLHSGAVPVGGGLAIMAVIALLWPLGARALDFPCQVLLLSAALLSITFWLNDLRDLWPVTRLAMQVLAVAVCLAAITGEARLLPVLPLIAERLLIAIGWVWFINLFNFMDGIDGLAGSEAIAVAAGYLAVCAMIGRAGPLTMLALLIIAACLGYMVWNWHPARIFMGDAGSIPLGLLLGALLLDLAVAGQLAAACILPLVFLSDATITLMRRLLAGKKPTEAHRDHFYQRAVLGGLAHDAVTLRVLGANLVLIVLALGSVRFPFGATVLAAGVVGLLLASLVRSSAPSSPGAG
jgi:UDP-N-acetylmuramyl pentapeptide phosphotransferase/UDP-N-acetylglucosamine-1-phosphate transferase